MSRLAGWLTWPVLAAARVLGMLWRAGGRARGMLTARDAPGDGPRAWRDRNPNAVALVVLLAGVALCAGLTLAVIYTTPGKIAGSLLAIGAGYRVSLQRTPTAACFRCHGTGRVRGWVFRWVRHRDWLCHGTGRLPRLGTALLMRETYHRIREQERPL